MQHFNTISSGKRKRLKRAYSSAAVGRLYGDWLSNGNSADAEINPALSTLRNRSRDLARNNDYVRRFLNLCKTNIVGHKGVQLQVRSKDLDGTIDKTANNIIEENWKLFCKKQNCTVSGQLSIIDLEKLIVESVMRDGEILLRKISPWKHNSHFFALEPIEADQLDHTYNDTLANGNRVVMGVEKDKWKRPVAYHILTKHPGSINGHYLQAKRVRIPADEIIHLFIVERVNQTRGVTWLASPAARCKMLDGYEEAELVASRTGAATMGLLVNPDGESFDEEDEDEAGDIVFDAEPGTFRSVPDGYDLKTFDPSHPSTAFADFEKAILRGISSGLNVSYVALSNNLEGVSFSSIRAGEIADRDHWKMLQTWLIEHFCTDVFESWLKMFLTSGVSSLPLGKFNKFNAPVWRPRGWKWVDPDKDSKTAERDIKNNLKSIWNVVGEQGEDLEEVLADNARAIELAEEYGIELHVFNGDKENADKDTEEKPDKED